MTPTFSGEMQLAGWSENHTGGCKVTFWLQSPEDLAAFRALTVRKGNVAGHRFMAALVEIGDDEQPVQQPKPQLGQYCSMAVSWCARPDFWEFLQSQYAREVSTPYGAASAVKQLTCVASRKEFDENEKAKAAFVKYIKAPYQKWVLARGKSVGYTGEVL
jgi:hypothetical protein